MAFHLEPIGEGPHIPLDRPIIFVGRHADCDVVIESKKISRRHCCIVQLHDKLVIRDLGSTNGIFFNGQRVEEAVLVGQDELQIGNLRYQVITGDPAPVATVAPQAKSAEDLGTDDQPIDAGRNGSNRIPSQEIPNT